jgi:ferredoxin
LASADGVALDVAAATIVGIPPLDIPPLAVARDWGQTTGRIEDIQISGLSLDQARLDPPFVLPKTVSGERRGGLITRLIGKWRPTKWLVVNPYSNARCTACGTCVRACPVQAITIVNKRAQMNLDKCIRCYCCHELCPHDAIDLKRHWLAEWLVK